MAKFDFGGFVRECYLRSEPSVDLNNVTSDNPVNCSKHRLSISASSWSTAWPTRTRTLSTATETGLSAAICGCSRAARICMTLKQRKLWKQILKT